MVGPLTLGGQGCRRDRSCGHSVSLVRQRTAPARASYHRPMGVPGSVLQRDLVFGVAVTAVAEVELLLAADRVVGPLVPHLVHSVLIVPALALRRRAPLAAVLIAAASLALQPLVGDQPVATGFLVLLGLLVSLGWYASWRPGLIGVASVAVAGLVFWWSGPEPLVADPRSQPCGARAWMSTIGASDRRHHRTARASLQGWVGDGIKAVRDCVAARPEGRVGDRRGQGSGRGSRGSTRERRYCASLRSSPGISGIRSRVSLGRARTASPITASLRRTAS